MRTPLHLLAIGAAMLASSAAAQHMVGGVMRNNFTGQANHFGGGMHGGHFHGFGNGIWVVEREVPVVVEVPVPTPPPVTPPLPPHQGEGEKRKPYVIGASYDSLPGSCMKLIEDGASFYYCSGEWYKQTGKSYRAVDRKL